MVSIDLIDVSNGDGDLDYYILYQSGTERERERERDEEGMGFGLGLGVCAVKSVVWCLSVDSILMSPLRVE